MRRFPLAVVPLHLPGEQYPWQVEVLRQIRNACRQGFSHDTRPISEAAQRSWWSANGEAVAGALYYRCAGHGVSLELVGYGLKRRESGKFWTSVAVLPNEGGHGYGGAITAHVIRVPPHVQCHASARRDNPAACALHRAEDWDVVGEDDRLIHYRTKPDIFTRPQRELKP